jgi:hypothetical protein
MTKPHFGHEALEAGSVQRRRAGTTQIIVNDHDLLAPPPKPEGSIRKSVL